MDQPDSAAFLIVDEAHMEMPELPLIQFIDGWETVEEMEAALGIPEGKLVASLEPVQRVRRPRRGSRLPQAAGIPCATRQRPVGRVRSALGQAMYSGFTVGGLATTVDGQVLREDGSVDRRACTRRALARRTSPRTARATPAAPSSVRAPSSAGAPASTRRHCAACAQAEQTQKSPKPGVSGCFYVCSRVVASRHSPPPSSSSRLSWCCSSVGR